MGMIEQFKLLKRYDFKLLPYGVAGTESQAIEIAEKIGYPVAMKIISDKIEHKTDVGGVKIGIRNHVGVRLAYKEIIESAHHHRITGVLIQKMARKGVELIVGGKKDPQFGHMVVLGLGGIYVEVFRDVTARICPVGKRDVEEMICELKAHPLITGTRGKKSININTLEKLVVNVSRFMQKEDILELDLNPVVFDEHGCD